MALGKRKPRRHDADDGDQPCVDRHRASHDGRVGRIQALPEIVADDRDALAARFSSVLFHEVPPHLRANTEQREQARGDRGSDDTLSFILRREREVAIDDAFDCCERS